MSAPGGGSTPGSPAAPILGAVSGIASQEPLILSQEWRRDTKERSNLYGHAIGGANTRSVENIRLIEEAFHLGEIIRSGFLAQILNRLARDF